MITTTWSVVSMSSIGGGRFKTMLDAPILQSKLGAKGAAMEQWCAKGILLRQ
jgi:hypothetical protein